MLSCWLAPALQRVRRATGVVKSEWYYFAKPIPDTTPCYSDRLNLLVNRVRQALGLAAEPQRKRRSVADTRSTPARVYQAQQLQH